MTGGGGRLPAIALVLGLAALSAGRPAGAAEAASGRLAWNAIRPGMGLAAFVGLPPATLSREGAAPRCEAGAPARGAGLAAARSVIDGDVRCVVADVHPYLPGDQASPWHCTMVFDFVGLDEEGAAGGEDPRLSRLLLRCSNVAAVEMVAHMRKLFGAPSGEDAAGLAARWRDGDVVLAAGQDEDGEARLALLSHALRLVPITRAVERAKARL